MRSPDSNVVRILAKIFVLSLVLGVEERCWLPLLVAAAAEDGGRMPVTLTLLVREDAVLFVQGERSKLQGIERLVESPPLAAGQDFIYSLRTEWSEDGLPQSLSRQIRVRSGERVVVDMRGDSSTPTGSRPIQRTPPVNSVVLSAEELEVIRLVNKERQKAGVMDLRPNPKLFVAAREHSRRMASRNDLNHALDGNEFWDRIAAAGYVHGPAGENIAEGPMDAAEAVKSWMESPGHRANILKESYQEIGVGVVRSTAGRNFWTQLFAAPKN